MSDIEDLQIDQQAREILRNNDRGGYTIPTEGLYPYQWNWDSVFVALGFATFDEPRAWQEIETLFEAQWPSGLVPHIVFRHDDPDYFPGPSVWGTDQLGHRLGLKWATSGISQPPVAATVIRDLYLRATNRADAKRRARALLPKLDAWHRWFHSARDPHGLGIIAISHPWESGRDNLPDWDAPGAGIDTSEVGEYKRRDTARVDADMRPKKADYDRYIALVQFGRAHGWCDAEIAASNPFWVADVGNTAILLRAERDLAALAEDLGESPQPAAPARSHVKEGAGVPSDADARRDSRMSAIANAASERVERMAAGFGRLWNEEAGAFCSLDLRSEQRASSASAATFLCFYAGAGSDEQRAALVTMAGRWAAKVHYLLPSYDPFDARFDALRYWRGPVWAMFNYLAARGLAESGEQALADRIREDTATLIRTSGFAEYFSPLDATPAGGNAFSWTAAMWLAWLSPRAR